MARRARRRLEYLPAALDDLKRLQHDDPALAREAGRILIDSPLDSAGRDRSVDRAGRRDPFGGLSGDPGYEIKVAVVVEDDKVCGLGPSGNEKIGDLRTAMLTSFSESVLDDDSSIEDTLIHGDERPRRPDAAHGTMRRRTHGRESSLEVRGRATGDETCFEERVETWCDLTPCPARQCGGVAEVVRLQPHAACRAAGPASNSGSTPRSASSARRRSSRARISTSAASTVAFSVCVPSSARTASNLESSTSISLLGTARGYPSERRG